MKVSVMSDVESSKLNLGIVRFVLLTRRHRYSPNVSSFHDKDVQNMRQLLRCSLVQLYVKKVVQRLFPIRHQIHFTRKVGNTVVCVGRRLSAEAEFRMFRILSQYYF